MPKKPVWVKGTPFPIECAIWNWATFLIEHGKRGTHQAYIDDMTKLHGADVVEKVKDLARKRWRNNKIGD